MTAKLERLMPNGVPRYIRCYDNGGKTADRYTIVFTRRGGSCLYLGCNAEPFHPQGIGMHGEAPTMIDRPGYSHLGRKFPFTSLPDDVRKLVLADYREIWGLP